jgi:hypothetical protein
MYSPLFTVNATTGRLCPPFTHNSFTAFLLEALSPVLGSVMGKHPDLMVGPPTSTVFPTNDRNFERSQFFEKIFEKI